MTTLIKILITFILALFSYIVSAQEITGVWNGTVLIQGTELPIIFNITAEGDSYTSTLKSPKQSNQEIPVDTANFDKGQLTISVSVLAITYQGKLEGEEIKGTFTQGGNSLPLDLKKGDVITETVVYDRPQEPVKPFPYISEEVVFENKNANNIKLSGTLTLPDSKKKKTCCSHIDFGVWTSK